MVRGGTIVAAMARAARDPRDELYDAYASVPPHQHAEIVRGTLYVMSRPAPRHASTSPSCTWLRRNPSSPTWPGGVSSACRSCPRRLTSRSCPTGFARSPSRSTEKLDRDEKLPLYAEHGVRHVWLLDPIAKSLEVYTLGDAGRWREVRTHRGDTPVRAEPFDAIELDLSALWSPPRTV